MEALVLGGDRHRPFAAHEQAREQRELVGTDLLDGLAAAGAELDKLGLLARRRVCREAEHAGQVLAGGERGVEVLGQQIDAGRSHA